MRAAPDWFPDRSAAAPAFDDVRKRRASRAAGGPPAARHAAGELPRSRAAAAGRPASTTPTRRTPTCMWPLRTVARIALPALNRARDVPGRGHGAAQARGRVRGLRARRAHARRARRSASTRCTVGERDDRGHRGGRACATPFAHARCTSARTMRRSGTARADRRADVRATSPRCCATPCARCSPTTTSTSPTGTTRATSRSSPGRFGLDEYIEHVMRFLARDRPGGAPDGDLPALRRRARGGGADGGGRPSGDAGEPDADGGADRLPHLADRGEQARDRQADRLVRAAPDQHGAVALCRRAAHASIRGSCSSWRS